MRYDPTASSLTRQAWAYQQHLIDEMGEGDWGGLGQTVEPGAIPSVAAVAQRVGQALQQDATRVQESVDKQTLMTCGKGFAAAALAGYVAGRIGVVPTIAGVGLAYALLRGLEPPARAA